MQKVLEYTEHMEDKEKAILKEMQYKHQKLCEELEKLKDEYIDTKTQYEMKCKTGIEIKEMMTIRPYISELVGKMEKKYTVVKRHEKEIDVQIVKLLSISREKKIMDKLKGEILQQL